MRRAIHLARNGMRAGDGGPFDTVIVCEGEIIGEGWNHVLTTNDPTAHGEIVAIHETQLAREEALALAEEYLAMPVEKFTNGTVPPNSWLDVSRSRVGSSRAWHGA